MYIIYCVKKIFGSKKYFAEQEEEKRGRNFAVFGHMLLMSKCDERNCFPFILYSWVSPTCPSVMIVVAYNTCKVNLLHR